MCTGTCSATRARRRRGGRRGCRRGGLPPPRDRRRSPQRCRPPARTRAATAPRAGPCGLLYPTRRMIGVAAAPSPEGHVPYPFVESPNVTATGGRRIDVVVIHTMEIAERNGAA